MASERQIEANRQNAQFSTGPKTPEGKAESNRNAVTHGLTARSGLLPGEDPEEFDSLREAVISQLDPENALEHELAERIVSVLWRLRRVPAFESALIAWLDLEKKKEATIHPLARLPTDDFTPFVPRKRQANDPLVLGRTVEVLLRSDFTGKLSRYETSLQRQLSTLLNDLRNMQMRRPASEEEAITVSRHLLGKHELKAALQDYARLQRTA